MSTRKKSVSIIIGDICITEPDPVGSTDKVWLAHRDGEAGQFSRRKLAKVLEKFFNKHF